MRYSTLFFDLDDTLYNSDTGIWRMMRERMAGYMIERMGMPADEVPKLRRHLFQTYGTTLRGLQVCYQINADDFLAYVHDVPLAERLQPNPALRHMLLSLPQRRWIFTNADVPHAERVLQVLGLEGCFQDVIDIKRMNMVCKPAQEVYPLAMEIAGEVDPRRCMMLDDAPRNLAPAYALGMATVLVGTPEVLATGEVYPDPTYHIPDLLHLPQALPELWNGTESFDYGG